MCQNQLILFAKIIIFVSIFKHRQKCRVEKNSVDQYIKKFLQWTTTATTTTTTTAKIDRGKNRIKIQIYYFVGFKSLFVLELIL
jgi:hypothetical protein